MYVFLQVEPVDDIELSSGPESEKTLPSETIHIPEEGLWGVGGGTEAFLWKNKYFFLVCQNWE